MNQYSINQVLQAIPLFEELTSHEINSLEEIAHTRKYPKGTHIFMQDDPLKNVYFVLEGQVKIYRMDIHGREQIVNILNQGEMFPHQGFFRQDGYPAHAEASEHCVLIYIPKKKFEDYLIRYPSVSIKIFRVLGDMIVDLQHRLEEQILHSSREQLMMLLLRLVKKNGTEDKNGGMRLIKQFSNKELANMIGTSRETISRTLSQLKKDKLIEQKSTHEWIIYADKIEEELFH
ncbi:CRP/FNR family transcriptional regulator, anaerobic regulatory protein [Gracilibacillus ureilyticus]|uniref:CRP/FNR family transcriptional regulator, anaerobic regulatory protein n=1 Tax=Gracilibacillus ureilyticus TaxID=531814 RepID=A0A1H9SQ83_9BACI|nr:Crp/Fnr family transcriptional regulator [Gracilibacillus ureilyticus]SER86573.1 CRP/FNR family transcriptional regulator, anaerobic regulatory protein [Gracilibacillus ureilyticus]